LITKVNEQPAFPVYITRFWL